MVSIDYLAISMSTCGGLSSTLIYSLEHGTEGISTTLKDAAWIRKKVFKEETNDYVFCIYLL